MADNWAKTKEIFTRDYKKDFESYNKPTSKWELLGELALVPVLLQGLMMLMACLKNLESLIQTSNIVYTSLLLVVAVIVDIFRSFIAERKYLILKGIVNCCCFIPILIYCIPKLYVAAVQFGHGQNNVLLEFCAFIYSNWIFYGLMNIYMKKDFKYLQSKGQLVTEDPETLTLGEKKVLSVYNILFYSNCYVVFVLQSLFVILVGPLHDSGFFRELMKPSRSECGRDNGGGFAIIFFLFFVFLICLYQLFSVVTIMQGLWVLSLKNPKNRNDVGFMAIA
uniref:XK-related protein n=1 Tax=Panagrellus redivivus TaxID=6233 RepID=A0A7E4W8E4_PANRE